MNEPVISFKTSKVNIFIYVNIAVLTLIISTVLNKYFGIGCGICCALLHFSNNRNMSEIVIDKEKDVFSFPSYYEYSLVKSILGLIVPLFKTISYTEVKLSNLQRVSAYKKKLADFIELYFSDNTRIILRFQYEKDAQQVLKALQSAKPELFCDNFQSSYTSFISNMYKLMLIFVVLWSLGIIHPISALSEKINCLMLPGIVKTKFFQNLSGGWKLDSVTEVVKTKSAYVVAAKFKNGSRTEAVKLHFNKKFGIYQSPSGEELRHFLLKVDCERALKEKFTKDKSYQGAILQDLKLFEMKPNKYMGILKLTKRGKSKEEVLHIEVSDNKFRIIVAPSLGGFFIYNL